ncbi:hypothetical protein [Chamaesiphon sp.]|uniref:hypothetical protein n=1 Tax=Chamaesiphon sp. TaxID=2814140 RepID=UPI003593FC7C
MPEFEETKLHRTQVSKLDLERTIWDRIFENITSTKNTHLPQQELKLLVEIKCFQPAKGSPEKQSLKGYLYHPDRYRRINCWIVKESENYLEVQIVGAEGKFKFVDRFCPLFLGEYPAVIISIIDPQRVGEADRFEALSAA